MGVPAAPATPTEPKLSWLRSLLGIRAPLARWQELLVIVVAMLCTPAPAMPVYLTLADRSVVSGEIESVQDGVYRLRSPSLGTVSVRESEIRRIEAATDAPAHPDSDTTKPGAAITPQIDALQRRIVGDDALMASVMALLDDPQVKDILDDPAVMDALHAGAIDALQRNPRFQSLMDDPTIREITKHMAQ